jgi:phosphomannomutase
MTPPPIKFGTDGWRGVIADDFTFANVRIAAAAITNYILQNEDPNKSICIGYDTRFGSPAFARTVAEVAAGAGIPVRLASAITPTPALSYAVRQLGAAGGVMITSSHNPFQWNGVKYKASYGGSGSPSIMAKIESYLGQPLRQAATPASIVEEDFTAPYLDAIKRFADLDAIARSGQRFAIDAMYGAGAGVRSSQASIRSRSSPMSARCRRQSLQRNARPASSRTATPTGSARSTRTATLSTRTRSSPSCCAGCSNAKAGRAA